MKKLLIYIIILAITLVISINLFAFYNTSSVSNNLSNSNDIRNTIIALDNFKTTITEMSDSQEAFILTGNSKYKEEYQTNLNNAYDNSNILLKNEIISTEDNNTLIDLIKDYDSINQSIFNSSITYPASPDFETLVINSNNAKLKILHSVSNLIATHRGSLEKSSNSLSKSISNQKNFISWISSIFTTLMAIPPLVIKKFVKNSNINNNITSLTQSNNNNSSNNDESSSLSDSISTFETFFNFQNNIAEIKEVRSQLIQNATLINYIRISSLNNSTINDKCKDCNNKLNSIISEVLELEKLYSNNLSNNSSDIYTRILNLKLSLSQLSSELYHLNDYNNYILKLNTLLLNKDNNS